MTESLYQYQYQFGDRPLEGYTIQRAVGRGGFGEVYFAISDSGRQVALKVIQNYEQIELRGIKQCMNLKNPHLVTIFDVKYNDKGRPFVIMEYVAGVSLRDLLDESPGGLGPQKAAFFLREIAKGLSFLHDCGIVHRDLKPSNIFYENGYVKIGDYGLTKAIAAGHASEQTITVGTVHYMAPEIGQGRYDLSIDIYALGIVLYEMVTGQVPFFGASPAEVLMKHLMDQPNLTGIEEPFNRAIKKALVKDPALRYRTVQEMVEDVFGQDHIRNSVSQFRPDDLSVIAQHIAAKAQVPPPIGERPTQPSPNGKDKTSGMAQMGEQIGRKIGSAGDQIAEKLAGAASGLERHRAEKASGPDSISRRQRRILAIVIIVVISLGVGLFEGGWRRGDFGMAFIVFLMMAGLIKGIIWAEHSLLEGLEPGPFRNALAAGMGILLAAIVASLGSVNGWTVLSLLVLGFVDWRCLTAPDRQQQIDWTPVVWASAIGGIVALIHGQPLISVGVIAGTILAAQVISPFGSPASASGQASSPPPPPSPQPPPPPPQAAGNSPEAVAQPVIKQPIPAANLIPEATVPSSGPETRSVTAPDVAPYVSPHHWTRPNPGQEAIPMYGQSATTVPTSTSQAPAGAIQAKPRRQWSFFAGLLAFIGYVLLIVGLLIGLGFSLHLPWLVASDVLDPGLAQEMEREFGYADWPNLVEQIGWLVIAAFLLLAMIFLILARRRHGIGHLFRAVAGIVLLTVSLAFLYYALPGREVYLSEAFKTQAAAGRVHQVLGAIQIPFIIGSVAVLIVGLTVMSWPATRQRREEKVLGEYDRTV